MKARIAMLALLLAAGAAGARLPDSLSPLARKYAVKREALFKDYAARRKTLVSSQGWSALTEEERKARLSRLEAEFAGKDAKLTADFDAVRRQEKGKSPIGETENMNEERRKLDDIRTKAAQDARNARRGQP